MTMESQGKFHILQKVSEVLTAKQLGSILLNNWREQPKNIIIKLLHAARPV